MTHGRARPTRRSHGRESTCRERHRTATHRAPTTMKAVVQHRYGPPGVLALEEIGQPVVGDEDVLIRVHTAGVSYPDGVVTSGIPCILRLLAGLRRPRHGVRGAEVAGTVAEVGAKVTDLRPGDEVLGWCGRSVDGGGFAEYARARRSMVVPKPATVTFEQAASLPVSGVTALQAVRDWGRCGRDSRFWSMGRPAGRDVRGPDRRGAGCRGDRRVQHQEPRAGPVDRRRSGHRLHQGGLHPRNAALRCHPRRSPLRHPLVGRGSTRADAQGDLRPDLEHAQPLDRGLQPGHPGAR